MRKMELVLKEIRDHYETSADLMHDLHHLQGSTYKMIEAGCFRCYTNEIEDFVKLMQRNDDMKYVPGEWNRLCRLYASYLTVGIDALKSGYATFTSEGKAKEFYRDLCGTVNGDTNKTCQGIMSLDGIAEIMEMDTNRCKDFCDAMVYYDITSKANGMYVI